MPAETIRVFSDIHYGDRASWVKRLEQLRPLCREIDSVIVNGDMLDTRRGPRPAYTAACRDEVMGFARASAAPITFLTGNHDPDFSPQHTLELAGGQVLVLHGDVLFEEIVPWGRDAAMIRGKITAALANFAGTPLSLEQRLALWRGVAAAIPQRHQSETNPWKYAWRFAADTVWPPLRFLHIIRAWRNEPFRATALAREHRPAAKFILLGHTHRPAIRQLPGGPIVINTGSFCPPFGGYSVDLTPHRLVVRRTLRRRGEFRAGDIVAEFPLATR